MKDALPGTCPLVPFALLGRAWASPSAAGGAVLTDPAGVVVTLAAALGVGAAVVWALTRGRGWFGRLPGDLRIERRGFTLYLPLATGLLLSVAVSLLATAAGWLLPYLAYAFAWLGRLPGDIHLRFDGVTVFVPVTSAVLLSVLASALVNGARWIGRRSARGRDEEGRDGL